ncbi:hypothetical protein ES288_A06G105000v1 [Gossypium darwinii]|uniref:TTF-type domain-containing protein n=1 Tax=Gossypium darwinii TaxID=34276 RepID=A0A5D2G670_GOSDA|nr:hypothetical protein ES288_A06G105000v1 [Gossypium darwinii]
MKSKTIDSFFKKKSTETTQLPSEASQIDVPPSSFAPLNSDARPSKISRVEDKALDLSNLEREPGLCKQIYEYPVNMRDEIRRAYIKVVPYQPILSEYPASNSKKHPRYFQPPWFKQFSWLEYSPSKDVVFCLPCFLFNSNPTSRFGSTAFTHNGFSNWKKVHDGCNSYVHLMNQAQHIEVSLDRQTTQQILANPLHLKTRCAFIGHDESSGSKNCGNFLELLSLLASYDEKVEDVLKSAPQNASYTSSTIQKEILHIYASRVRNVIREEIGDRKFSIIMDEERDESKKEQMAIILRFFDKQRQVKERFFDIVHVKDTASLTLKNVIFNVLLQHSFDIQNIRGQGYDGASNMRGEFNGLQALILNDCRYAYYLREVVEVHQFFKDLSDIVNIASTSSKRHNELQKAQAAEISHLIGTLQCPGDTRWSSYLNSVTSLLKMYDATSTEVLGITDNLCQALQRHSQDILNAMSLNELLKNVISFCETSELDFPDMNAQYIVGHSRNKKEDLQEFKSRFNKNVVELLTLTTALDPKEFFKLFDIDKICILVNKFYSEEFSQQEKERLPYELKHYELDVCKHLDLRKIPTLSELCRSLVESGKSMEDDFLRSSLVMYIEKEIAEKFDINEIIDDFSKVKARRVQFK